MTTDRTGPGTAGDDSGGGGGGTEPPKAGKKRGFFRELPGLVLVALVLALVLKTTLVQAFYIPSGSMIPTLNVGDRVLVNKLVYNFGEPQRFDIIVFENPNVAEVDRGLLDAIWSWLTEGLGVAGAQEQDFIKRVIGLPGDEIEGRNGRVFVNGQQLHEPPSVREPTGDFGPLTVGPDQVFVMGDNRGNSDDSRGGLGQVPYDKIVGKAFILIWPPSNLELVSDD